MADKTKIKNELFKKEVLPRLVSIAKRLGESDFAIEKEKSGHLYFEAYSKTGNDEYLQSAIEIISRNGSPGFHQKLLTEFYKRTKQEKYLKKIRKIIKDHGWIYGNSVTELFSISNDPNDLLKGIDSIQKRALSKGKFYEKKKLGVLYGEYIKVTQSNDSLKNLLTFLEKYEKKAKKKGLMPVHQAFLIGDRMDILAEMGKSSENPKLVREIIELLEEDIKESDEILREEEFPSIIGASGLEFLVSQTGGNRKTLKKLEDYYGMDDLIESLGEGTLESNSNNLEKDLEENQERLEYFWNLTGDKKYLEIWKDFLLTSGNYERAINFMDKYSSEIKIAKQ